MIKDIEDWRLAGIIAIVVLGFLWHYLYSWTNHSKIIGSIAPVNESLWEHLKLGYWSLILYSLVEYMYLQDKINNYFLGKLLGILALEMTILLIYYGYTWIAGRDIFWLDIGAYVLGAILCQYIAHYIFAQQDYGAFVSKTSLMLFSGIGVLLAITTYYPPHTGIFKDNNQNTYGIFSEK
jgi:hypothetical protein